MTFKGFAESSARGFKSFQIQLPTKEVLANMKEASKRELGYKKDNLTAYKENRREYLNQLVSNQNIQSKNLREVQDFRNENLKQVQKWEMKRWQDKVDKAKEEVNRIGRYGQQSPSPSTLESIAGLIGEYAPKLAAIIQEQKVAEAKAEKDFVMQLVGNTGLTTKQQNEISSNIEAIKAQNSQGIEIRKRVNEQLGLTGERAITVEQMARISNLTGNNQLVRDQMLAHNAVQKYPVWFQSKVNIPLSELGLQGYGEGETAAHVLNPNLGHDPERASNMMTQLRSIFMNDAELGNPGDLPLSTQGHSMFASLRKHDQKILAEYGRGSDRVIAQGHKVEQQQELQVAWYQRRQGDYWAMVNLRDRWAQDYSHMPGGGNTHANGLIYQWMSDNIKSGLISPDDVNAFNTAMASKYPDKWQGQGWPEKFRQLAAESHAFRHSQEERKFRQKKFNQRMAEENWGEILNANPDLADLSHQELREKLIDEGFDTEAASRIVSKTFNGRTGIEAGSSVSTEKGGLFEIGINGLHSKFIRHHSEQNGSTILTRTEFGKTTANDSVGLMMQHATQMYRNAYDAEYSESRDHTRAQQFAAGTIETAIKNGEFDMSPNKHMVDGKEQQRTKGSDFHWIHAPKGVTQISDAKSQVVTRIGQLKETNPTNDEYINKVTSKNFIPPEVIQSSISRGGHYSLASFMGHPAVQSVLENGPKELTAGYLYQQVLESHGYAGAIPDDRVMDPDEYRRSSQQTKERLRVMDATPASSEFQQVSYQVINSERNKFLNVDYTATVNGQRMGKSEYIPLSGRLRGLPGNKHNISAEELSYAINTIMGEAGPDDDQYYVMAVILNRKAANPHLHIRDIVSAPKQFVGYKHGRQIDSGLLAHFMSAEGMAKTYEAQLHLGNRTQFRGTELYPNMGDGDVRPNGASNYYFHSPQAAGRHVRYNPAWHSYSWQSIWSGPLQRSREPDPTFGTGVPSNPEGYTITPKRNILGLEV